MIAVRALMNPAAQAPQAELRLGLRRAIRAVRVHIRRGVGLVQKSIEFLAVTHTRVGHVDGLEFPRRHAPTIPTNQLRPGYKHAGIHAPTLNSRHPWASFGGGSTA